MAYSKQTWTDDVSAVTGARMTHIEQGIYDNSLATDKINPSGTATTTAEIEEGQITDVIGFKSLKLKGQTSQYTTTGSQLFDINNTPSANKQYVINNGFKLTKGTNRTIQISLTNPIPAGTYYISADVINSTLSGNNKINVSFKDANNADVVGNVTFLTNGAVTTTAEVKDLYFFIASNEADTATITLDNIMLNSGSTRKNFEKYTGGKASPNPDFPQDVNNVSGDNVVRISNKNLYDKDDSNLIMNNVYINATGFVLTSANNMKTICMPCRANTTYTVSKTLSSRFVIGTASSNTIGISMTAGRTNASGTQVSVSSGANDKYLFIFYYHGTADTKTEQEIRNSIQVEIGSTATTYTTHQGNNFSIDLPVENKLPYPYVDTTKTNNGITYTDLGDGRIKINGTATANSAFKLLGEASSQVAIPGNYVYGGVNSNVRVRAMNRTSSGTYTTLGSSIGSSTKIDKSTYSTGYVEISIASGTTVNNLIITPMLSDNEVNAFTPYNENPIELCKIGTYQDYIFKKDGKWWKHNEVGKMTFNGSENWYTVSTNQSGKYRAQFNLTNAVSGNVVKPSSNANVGILLCDYYTTIMAGTQGTYGANEGISLDVSGYVQSYNDDYNTNDISLYKTWLASNNMTIYWVYATPIEEEITYTPLIRQLDELYNSGLYDNTNISQDNSSEAFILDLEACKNNINGIVEYIRR